MTTATVTVPTPAGEMPLYEGAPDPQAGHAFGNDARPDRYHEESATDAWPRALAWFAAHGKAPAAA